MQSCGDRASPAPRASGAGRNQRHRVPTTPQPVSKAASPANKAAPLGPGTCRVWAPWGTGSGELAFLNSAPAPAQAQPRQSRRTPRPPSPRGAARPQPLIGCGCDGGGNWLRAADSRWRRPGGGVQPSRQKGQECGSGGGGPRLAASAPGRGRWRTLEPALWTPRRDSTGRRRCHLPSLSQLPLFCAAALAHHLPSSSGALSQSPGGG